MIVKYLIFFITHQEGLLLTWLKENSQLLGVGILKNKLGEIVFTAIQRKNKNIDN